MLIEGCNFSHLARSGCDRYGAPGDYQTNLQGKVQIESGWTACQRGWQLPEGMRDLQSGFSTSPVPNSEGPGNTHQDRAPLKIRATRRREWESMNTGWKLGSCCPFLTALRLHRKEETDQPLLLNHKVLVVSRANCEQITFFDIR